MLFSSAKAPIKNVQSKYIVSYIHFKYSPAPCPQQKEFEEAFGSGYSCAVAHIKQEEIKDSLVYFNRDSAYNKYNGMLEEKEKKSCVKIYNGITGEEKYEYINFLYPYTDIKIDSLQL